MTPRVGVVGVDRILLLFVLLNGEVAVGETTPLIDVVDEEVGCVGEFEL